MSLDGSIFQFSSVQFSSVENEEMVYRVELHLVWGFGSFIHI